MVRKKGLSVEAVCKMAVTDKRKSLMLFQNFDEMILSLFDDDKLVTSSARFKDVNLVTKNIPVTYKKRIKVFSTYL